MHAVGQGVEVSGFQSERAVPVCSKAGALGVEILIVKVCPVCKGAYLEYQIAVASYPVDGFRRDVCVAVGVNAVDADKNACDSGGVVVGGAGHGDAAFKIAADDAEVVALLVGVCDKADVIGRVCPFESLVGTCVVDGDSDRLSALYGRVACGDLKSFGLGDVDERVAVLAVV